MVAKKEEVPAEEEKNKVPQPDRAEHDAKVQKIQDEIDKLTKKQKERQGEAQAELRTQLEELSEKMNELQADKERIDKAVGNKREEGREMRTQLNTMKQKSMGYNSEQEIDNRIASIEFQLCTESVPLKEREEKKLLAEIQLLKKNRSKEMQSYREEKKKIQAWGGSVEGFSSVGFSIKHMVDNRSRDASFQEKMTELQESRKAQLGDMSDILEKRDNIGKEIQDKIKERNELRDEFRQKEREYNAYQARERVMAEKAERQKEIDLRRKQRKAEELDTQPYISEPWLKLLRSGDLEDYYIRRSVESEITLIEQTILFCKNLVQTKAEDKKDEKKEVVHNNKEGEEDREEEFYFAPTKGKKSKSKNKSSESAPAAKPIRHNAGTFSLFKQLELDAPMSTDEVPALLEKLEGLLEDYKVKVKEWEQTKDEQKKRILEGLEEIEEKKAARAAADEAEGAEETKEEKEEEAKEE
eukprot:Skav219157  [mRNA]  locus=scaffold1574:869264:879006:- [translate_table: standard]